MSERKPKREDGGETPEPPHPPSNKGRVNIAPDAVKDPNEKTEGHPGVPPNSQDDEVDPGAG